MKKGLIIIMLFVCLMAHQAKSDNVIIKRDTLSMIFFSPFDSYSGIKELRNQLHEYASHCTEDNCSFFSTWKIINNRLMLTKIENCKCNQEKQTANLETLFTNRLKNGMLEAEWYTGEIWATKDRMPTSRIGMSPGSWTSETQLIVKKGVVISVKNFVYPKPVENVYYSREDSLNKFIYSHINWGKLHNLPRHNKRFYFRFDQDAQGYPINIKYESEDGSAQPFDLGEMEEISRVLGMLQWPMYYRHGRLIMNFNSAGIILSKDVQDRFKKK